MSEFVGYIVSAKNAEWKWIEIARFTSGGDKVRECAREAISDGFEEVHAIRCDGGWRPDHATVRYARHTDKCELSGAYQMGTMHRCYERYVDAKRKADAEKDRSDRDIRDGLRAMADAGWTPDDVVKAIRGVSDE